MARLDDFIYTDDFKDYEPIKADPKKLLRQMSKRISPPDRKLLTEGTTEEVDRSGLIFALAARLLERGVPFDAAFKILEAAPDSVNKFQGRSDQVQRVYETLKRAEHKVKSSPDNVRHLSTAKSDYEEAPMEFVRHSEFMSQAHKPPEWLVEGIWAEQGRGLIVAESKSSKSTVAYDLLLSVATGAPFLGHFPVRQQGEVLLLQEEMHKGEVQLRGRRMMSHKGVEDTGARVTHNPDGTIDFEPSDVPLTYVNNAHFDFTDEAKRDQVERWIKAHRPLLVCFDPLQYMLGGLNINSQQEITPILRWLDYLWDEYHTGIILVHHLNKGREDQGPMDPNRILGSQALRAWHQCLLMLRRSRNKITVAREFRSFQEDPFSFTLDWGDEEDPLYEIEVTGGQKRGDALLDLVHDQPGIPVVEAAEKLKVSQQSVRAKAKRLKLCGKMRKPPKGTEGGRPSLCLYPPKVK